jgi:SAM-dependent methyltransferase
MTEKYLIDGELEPARERLDRLQALDDPGTIAHLEEIGVTEGWHCLEAGAGGGSVAAWLSRRIGARGRVVATDLDTRFVRDLGLDNLEAREQDIVSGNLEEEAFDLVHARSLLMHVVGRDEAFRKLAAAVRPGGWILLEEPDASYDTALPAAPPESQALYRRTMDAIYEFARSRGVDPNLGRELPGRLHDLGFVSPRAEGRLHVFRGGVELRSAHMPALAEIRDLVVARGHVTGPDYDAFLALADDPTFVWQEGLMMSAWGRRPA